MNIFILDNDPKLAAQMLCDRHLNKMILESAQMLSCVAERYGYASLYKTAYKNHPCTLWAGDRFANWVWLIEHALEMNEEKKKRNKSFKNHSSVEVIKWYLINEFGPPKDNLPMTSFTQAMPDIYKDINTVKAYRNYYLGSKQFFKDGKRPTWKNTNPPDWWEFR